jgi:hypothetical protein
MEIYQEMTIGAVSVQAHRCVPQSAVGSGHEMAQERAQWFDVLCSNLSAHRVGVRRLTLAADCGLYSPAQVRESIEVPARCVLPDVDGTTVWLEGV